MCGLLLGWSQPVCRRCRTGSRLPQTSCASWYPGARRPLFEWQRRIVGWFHGRADDFRHVPPHRRRARALSESGLAYCTDQFDTERFHRGGGRAREMAQRLAEEPLDEYDPQVASAAGYTTPKIDVRGGVFDQEGRVLLVREIADGNRWTLPGGWCDVLETPRQAVEREVEEEAGFAVRAVHLAAVIDREQWPHEPAYDRHIYKLFFVCKAEGVVDLSFTGDETSQV